VRLPLAKHGRGDRQHRVDERQLQLLVPFAAFGSEGRLARIRSLSTKVAYSGEALVWLG